MTFCSRSFFGVSEVHAPDLLELAALSWLKEKRKSDSGSIAWHLLYRVPSPGPVTKLGGRI